ncbi:uncharacterized protein PRCAT00003897001 [Priceomyces carsonii]|uniref:uncharacterized protein n=1 Tax=Priceomyces carsonii TaxID=28549 RepID=UPI002ED7AD7C|nr:unnamed protein product [Priceomyces carsonii]
MSSSSSIDKATEGQVLRVHTTGDGNEFVILGNKKYYKHELMQAFGGTFNPDRYATYPVHQFGNASALGLCAFSLTTFVLGLFYSGAMGIKVPNVVISLAFFYGGAVIMVAGIFEMIIGNTFAGTAFTSYGPFWLSFGTIYVKSFGISDAYADAPEQLSNGIGFFLIGWIIFTFLLLLCTLKSTVMFVLLFVVLEITFILLAAANFTGSALVTKAGGIFAVITALVAWYNAFAGVATKHNSYLRARTILLPIIGSSE